MNEASVAGIDARTIPLTPNMALRQGVAAAQARDFDRACELLRQVTTQLPADAVAWYWLAIASPSADAAMPCLRRVLSIDPSHLQAREALVRLLLTAARAAAADGHPADARALATEAAQIAPDAQAPWVALAALASDHGERINALRQAVTLAPDDLRLRTQLRQALLARGVMISRSDRAEARARFREAAELSPLDVRIWQVLARLADSPDEILQSLRDLMRVAPDHGSARVALRNALGAHAHAHAQAGRNEEACERWREAIAVGGGDVEAWLGLSEATADQDEAARAVEMAYQLDPADARALAAMERLQGPQFDPATVAAPDDAFARFGPLDDELTPFELTNESQEPIDSLLDAFATAAEPPQTAALESEAAASAGVEVTPPAPIEIAMAPPEVLEVPEALAGSASPAVLEVPDVPPALPAEPASTPGPIMIVDDSPTIRKILGLTLERAGYTVVAECDGQSALDRLQEVVPQLILLDISMPKLDGYEVCKRIKLDPRIADVPVIMLSGKGAFFDKVKGHMAGATEYLTKPFETPAVLAVVTGYCRPAAEQHHG